MNFAFNVWHRKALKLLLREPQLLFDSMFYVSGEIARVTEYEVGFPGHLRKSQDGARWYRASCPTPTYVSDPTPTPSLAPTPTPTPVSDPTTTPYLAPTPTSIHVPNPTPTPIPIHTPAMYLLSSLSFI